MTLEKIVKVLSEFKDFDPAEITRDTTLESIGLDSLDVVDFVMKLEDEFGVAVPMEKELLVNLGSVVDFIEANKK